MKRNIKNTLYTGFAVVSSVVAMVSCSDTWDEHYDSTSAGAANGTLMQSIEKNAPDFARVIKAVKFDKELSAENSFTVWAPQHFNVDSVLALAEKDSADVVDGFVKNHIARYNISMDGSEKTINLINNKKSVFNTQKFSSSSLVKTNITCENGILHVIDNGCPYMMNIFELLKNQYKESDYAHKDEVGGSLYTFLRKYDADSLDYDKSVSRGYDEFGEQIWVDSVVIRNNTVLKNVNALIYEEDSNYIAILPSPEAYHKRFLAYKKLLKFNDKLNENKSVDGIDVCDSLANHYANMFAMNDLFYNVTNNAHMDDSLKSTTYASAGSMTYKDGVYYRHDIEGQLKPSHDILAGLTPVKCSNGTAYLVDEYPISMSEQAYYEIPMQLSPSFMTQTSDKNNKSYTQNINTESSTGNTKYGIYYYKEAKDTVWVGEDGEMYHDYIYDEGVDVNNLKQSYVDYYYFTTSGKQVVMSFFIPFFLSGTYDISLVTVPVWRHDYYFNGGDFTPSEQRTKFNVFFLERNNKGEYPNSEATSCKFENKTDRNDDGKGKKGGKYDFWANNDCVVDSVYLGEYTFSNTYYGRGYKEDNCGAMIQIKPERGKHLVVSRLVLTPKEIKEDE